MDASAEHAVTRMGRKGRSGGNVSYREARRDTAMSYLRRKAEVLRDQGIGFEMGTNPVFLILAWQQKLRIVVYLHRVNS